MAERCSWQAGAQHLSPIACADCTALYWQHEEYPALSHPSSSSNLDIVAVKRDKLAVATCVSSFLHSCWRPYGSSNTLHTETRQPLPSMTPAQMVPGTAEQAGRQQTKGRQQLSCARPVLAFAPHSSSVETSTSGNISAQASACGCKSRYSGPSTLLYYTAVLLGPGSGLASPAP